MTNPEVSELLELQRAISNVGYQLGIILGTIDDSVHRDPPKKKATRHLLSAHGQVAKAAEALRARSESKS